MKKLRNEKGLSLIVLVVMIIVMVILSAVVIRSAVNRGTIDQTKNTRQKITEFSENSTKDSDQLYNLVKSNTFD